MSEKLPKETEERIKADAENFADKKWGEESRGSDRWMQSYNDFSSAINFKILSVEQERDELKKQMEESLLLYNNQTKTIFKLTEERDRTEKMYMLALDEMNNSFHIDANELCDVMQNICQLLQGIKPDAVAEKWWSEWDESVFQSALSILRKVQPYYDRTKALTNPETTNTK